MIILLLTDARDNQKIFVNMSTSSYWHENDLGGTRIYLQPGHNILVKESPEGIARLCRVELVRTMARNFHREE